MITNNPRAHFYNLLVATCALNAFYHVMQNKKKQGIINSIAAVAIMSSQTTDNTLNQFAERITELITELNTQISEVERLNQTYSALNTTHAASNEQQQQNNKDQALLNQDQALMLEKQAAASALMLHKMIACFETEPRPPAIEDKSSLTLSHP